MFLALTWCVLAAANASANSKSNSNVSDIRAVLDAAVVENVASGLMVAPGSRLLGLRSNAVVDAVQFDDAMIRAPGRHVVRVKVRGSQGRWTRAAAEVFVEKAERRLWVRRGEAVSVAARVGAVSVSANGTSQGDGAVGDSVLVLMPYAHKPLVATVTGPQTLEVRP